MEEECRKFLLIRVIDREDIEFDLNLENALSTCLANHFGKAYNHRLELILQEVQESQKSDTKSLNCVSLPITVWPVKFSDPTRPDPLSGNLSTMANLFIHKYKERHQ